MTNEQNKQIQKKRMSLEEQAKEHLIVRPEYIKDLIPFFGLYNLLKKDINQDYVKWEDVYPKELYRTGLRLPDVYLVNMIQCQAMMIATTFTCAVVYLGLGNFKSQTHP